MSMSCLSGIVSSVLVCSSLFYNSNSCYYYWHYSYHWCYYCIVTISVVVVVIIIYILIGLYLLRTCVTLFGHSLELHK